MKATVPALGTSSSFTSTFQFHPGNLTVALAGGDSRVISHSTDALVFNVQSSDFSNPFFGFRSAQSVAVCSGAVLPPGAAPSEPNCAVTYRLTCMTHGGNPCVTQSSAAFVIPISLAPSFTIPAGTLKADHYIFSVSMSKVTGLGPGSAASASLSLRTSNPWNTPTQSVNVLLTPTGGDNSIAPPPLPVRTLPPRFLLSCPHAQQRPVRSARTSSTTTRRSRSV